MPREVSAATVVELFAELGILVSNGFPTECDSVVLDSIGSLAPEWSPRHTSTCDYNYYALQIAAVDRIFPLIVDVAMLPPLGCGDMRESLANIDGVQMYLHRQNKILGSLRNFFARLRLNSRRW